MTTAAHAPRNRAWIGLALILCAIAALPLDVTISRYFHGQGAGNLREMLVVGQAFGGGMGVVLIACLLWLIAPGDRRRLPRLLIAAYGAGLSANLIKLLVSRVRPVYFNIHFPQGTVTETFTGWLKFGEGGSPLQSFPSAHTAMAFGLAAALLRYYPQARPVIVALSVAAGLQRIVTDVHYLSDTFCGAGVGWLFGCACCYEGTRLTAFLDALEVRWARWVASEAPRAQGASALPSATNAH